MGHANQLFCGAGSESLIGRISPDQAQREFLQKHWNDLADHLVEALQSDHGYKMSTWIQGSYKYGTLLKPVSKGQEYDVDLGVYFEWTDDKKAAPSPRQLRDWVQAELHRYGDMVDDIDHIEEPPKDRCSRAAYKHQFHIDTPIYHLDSSANTRRLAHLDNHWESKDPKPLVIWFKTVVEEHHREQLRRLVRYIKAWAVVAFELAAESRPSSIMLTVLVAEAFRDTLANSRGTGDDDDVLVDVIARIFGRLDVDPRVPNPVDSKEDLNRIQDSSRAVFYDRLKVLYESAQRASGSEDEAGAALAWSGAFSFLIPLPDTEVIELLEKSTGAAIMQLPEIQIEVCDESTGRVIDRYRNSVPLVPKGRKLVFSIVNPNILPAYATIEWTVRNSDVEASSIGDLGHRRAGVGKLQVEESTAYVGHHFMDCVVSLNGAVYAMRRVPVFIANLAVPPRNSPKPAYARLRSRFRR